METKEREYKSKALALDADETPIAPIFPVSLPPTSIYPQILKERFGSLFRFVPNEILNTIDWAYVFPSRAGAIFAVQAGYLYAIGRNGSGQLGVNDTNPVVAPKRLPILQRIKQIAYASSGSTYIVSKAGKVWSCGQNGSSQLGQGHTNVQYSFQPINAVSLRNVEINYVAAGSSSVWALSSDGRIFGWGANGNGELGQNTSNNESTPVPITRNINMQVRVVQLTCGANHALCLTEPADTDEIQGLVYTWGYNGYGQLGFGDTTNRLTPTQLPLETILNPGATAAANTNALPPTRKDKKEKRNDPDVDPVTQIACSYNTSFLRTRNGKLFSCGSNNSGELGLGDSSNRNRFTQVTYFSNNQLAVAEITSHSTSYLAVAVVVPLASHPSLTSSVSSSSASASASSSSSSSSSSSILASHSSYSIYAWGNLGSLNTRVPNPLLMHMCTTVDDVFMIVAETGFTYRPLSIQNKFYEDAKISNDLQLGGSLIQSIRAAFDNPQMSDFCFVVENKSIYVHSFILSKRSEHFATMLANQWSGIKERKVEIHEHSYPTYYAYLKFLYTGELNDVEPVLAFQIMDLAASYHHKEVQVLCEHIIKRTISIHNVTELAQMAVKYNAAVLRQFCVNFVVENLMAVVSLPNFKEKFPESLLKDIFIQAAQANKLISPF